MSLFKKYGDARVFFKKYGDVRVFLKEIFRELRVCLRET